MNRFLIVLVLCSLLIMPSLAQDNVTLTTEVGSVTFEAASSWVSTPLAPDIVALATSQVGLDALQNNTEPLPDDIILMVIGDTAIDTIMSDANTSDFGTAPQLIGDLLNDGSFQPLNPVPGQWQGKTTAGYIYQSGTGVWMDVTVYPLTEENWAAIVVVSQDGNASIASEVLLVRDSLRPGTATTEEPSSDGGLLDGFGSNDNTDAPDGTDGDGSDGAFGLGDLGSSDDSQATATEEPSSDGGLLDGFGNDDDAQTPPVATEEPSSDGGLLDGFGSNDDTNESGGTDDGNNDGAFGLGDLGGSDDSQATATEEPSSDGGLLDGLGSSDDAQTPPVATEEPSSDGGLLDGLAGDGDGTALGNDGGLGGTDDGNNDGAFGLGNLGSDDNNQPPPVTTEEASSDGGLLGGLGGDDDNTNFGGTLGNDNSNTAGTAQVGVEVACDGGANITNGAEVIVIQMRSGFTYTATAIGLNGFDPVIAVLGETGQGLCNDNDAVAAGYELSTPTTGAVFGDSTSAQIFFSQNVGQFADVSLVVSDVQGRGGEFVLILEGMAVTEADGVGDPFAITMSPNLLASDIDPTVYMIANVVQLDPVISMPDGDDPSQILSVNGELVLCDDAGDDDLCYGNHATLVGHGIEGSNGRIPGGDVDAMLQIPLSGDTSTLEWLELVYLMSGYDYSTFGEYTLLFHMGVSG